VFLKNQDYFKFFEQKLSPCAKKSESLHFVAKLLERLVVQLDGFRRQLVLLLELLGVLQHEGAALREQRDRLSQLKSTGANF
jgi:hypothetical protein